MNDSDLGRKIAAHRQRRGLSQKELGRLIERSEAWISQVERGVRTVKTLDALERIAAALEIPLAEMAPTAPTVVAEQQSPDAVSLRLMLSANYALRAVVSKRPAQPDDVLLDAVQRAWELAHGAEYRELIPLLEQLLPDLESATRHANGSRRDALFAALARAYHACSAALAKLRQVDAAWVAADRAITLAERAHDPLLMAEGAFRLCLVFQGARQLEQAEQTASTAAAVMETVIGEKAKPEALSLFGALQLQLAVVAARQERADSAREHLAKASWAAGLLGADRNDYETEFGPTNVALHDVAVSVELGDAGQALRRAAGIDAHGLSRERQARLKIDVARAWTQRRNVGEAVTALEQAEQLTPEQVREHGLVQGMVRDLLRMEPTPPAALAALAERIETHT